MYCKVRKREWPKKGSGKFAYIVDYIDPRRASPSDAKRRARIIETYKSKADADARARQIMREMDDGKHTPRRFSPAVAEAGAAWIEDCEAHGLQRTTLDGYRDHLKRHINPYFGLTKLADLTARSIGDFGRALRLGKLPDGKERSADLTNKVLVSLGSLLAFAHREEMVAQNVAARLKKPAKPRKPKLQVGVDIPAPDEIKALVGALPGNRYRPLLITAIFSGLRASELRGLRWQDVDLDKRALHVRQRADRYNAIDLPKTRAGERAVPLPPLVVNTLKEWNSALPQVEGRAGVPDTHRRARQPRQHLLARHAPGRARRRSGRR